MTLERERKLAVLEGFALPPLDDLPGLRAVPIGQQDLRTLYVDTPELSLLRWGCTLREREGEGWSLKLHVGGRGRELVRDERTFPTSGRAPPAEAKDLVQAFTRGGALRPLVRLRTRRDGVELRGRGDGIAATIVFDRVTVLAGGKVVGRFAEVEIERYGPDELPGQRQLLALLERAGAVENVTNTKLERALLLAGRQVPAELSPSLPDGDFVRRAFSDSVERLIRADPGVRIGEDTEAVHEARVAIRHLRSHLRSFASIMDGSEAAAIRGELAWLADSLGFVRDLDVLLEALARERSLSPASLDRGIGEVVDRFRSERVSAREALLGQMRSHRYQALLDTLEALATSPPLLPGALAPSPRDVMESGWQRLRRAAADAGPSPNDEQLHRIRILAKRVRYAAEALIPIVGKPAASFARDAQRLQDVLGRQHDSVVRVARLTEFVETSEPQTAFAAGWLAGRRDGADVEASPDWHDAWRSLSKRKRRFW